MSITTDELLDVLAIVTKRAQWCRENGESDMRNILYTVSSIRDQVRAGKSPKEIVASFADDEAEQPT